jgi:hypothetical protein
MCGKVKIAAYEPVTGLRDILYYLDCGDLHHGFARVKCRDCLHEYLLAFVLKRSGNPALRGTIPGRLT